MHAHLHKPGAIYHDTGSGNLVFVADGIGPNKAAVEFVGKAVKRKGVNQITTAFRVDDEAIAGAVKGGQWLPVEVSGRRVGVEPT